MSSLRELDKIHIRAWIKPLSNSDVLLWDTVSVLKVHVSCNAEALTSLPCGTLVEIAGSLDKEGLCVELVKVIHKPLSEDFACTIDELPRDPVEYALKYPMYVRHPKVARIIKTYSLITNYMRTILLKRGFIELPTVVVGPASDPGLRGASKARVELYGKMLELQSSMIMYKQLYASVFDKVFYVAKNVRVEPLENAYTGRHLVEFTQVDVEWANASSADLMKLGEVVLYKAVKYLVREHSEVLDDRELERVEREIVKPPYPRLTYEEAVKEALSMGLNVKYGQELSFEAEAAIAKKHGTPVWIEGFPCESRGFYYMEDSERPGHNVDFNLLLPSGHGEVLDGGCREYRYELVLDRIVRRHRENPEKYKWFLDLLKAGLVRPTCGWGIGVERLVKYLHGLEHIVYASPHPRIPGIISP